MPGHRRSIGPPLAHLPSPPPEPTSPRTSPATPPRRPSSPPAHGIAVERAARNRRERNLVHVVLPVERLELDLVWPRRRKPVIRRPEAARHAHPYKGYPVALPSLVRVPCKSQAGLDWQRPASNQWRGGTPRMRAPPVHSRWAMLGDRLFCSCGLDVGFYMTRTSGAPAANASRTWAVAMVAE